MTIEAKVIAHSSHEGCPDLITIQARYPRFIHSEVMTHRVFSRNASSSRAVPVSRMIEEVWKDPAMPVEWGGHKTGMQAGPEIENVDGAKNQWFAAAASAVRHANTLLSLGLHKQIVNRVLEPFSHISIVITATDWDNFFALRCHPDADPTMRALAEAMRDAIDLSVAWNLKIGEWHKPYGGMLKHSAARCARVSYLNHDGTEPDTGKDDDLAQMLIDSGHWSPFEHQATPTPNERHANLNGWMSHRTALGA